MTLLRPLYRWRALLIMRRFNGRGYGPVSKALVRLLEVPIHVVQAWTLRHLWVRAYRERFFPRFVRESECRECGYKKENTILIPEYRCPSCGGYLGLVRE